VAAKSLKGITYEVEGGARLRATLKDVENGLKDLAALHQEVADIAASRARIRVPVLTGTLQSTIRASGTKNMAVIRAGYAKVPYAGVHEWGWPKHNIVEHPYLRAGAHETEPQWRKLYDKRVDELLSKVEGA
jgi:hypothetical protein